MRAQAQKSRVKNDTDQRFGWRAPGGGVKSFGMSINIVRSSIGGRIAGGNRCA